MSLPCRINLQREVTVVTMQSFALTILVGSVVQASRLGWIRGARSPPSTLLDFTVAVSHTPSSLRELETTFWEVSNPTHNRYTDFLTRNEVRALMMPPRSSTAAVAEWLRPHCELGFPPVVSPGGDFVACPVTVGSAERGLIPGAQYHEFTKDNFTVHRTGEHARVSDPRIKHMVDFVSPTHRFPSVLTLRADRELTTRGSAGGNLGTDPTSIRALYNIPNTPATGNPQNQQHVAGFLSKFMDPRDLDLFYAHYYPEGKSLANGKPRVGRRVGGWTGGKRKDLT